MSSKFEEFLFGGAPGAFGSESKKSMIARWAVEACNMHVHDSVDPSEAVLKLVNEHGLNKNEAARLVEKTNGQIYGHKYRSGYDMNIDYPLASTEAVLSRLPTDEQKAASVKVARAKPAAIFDLESSGGTPAEVMGLSEKRASHRDDMREINEMLSRKAVDYYAKRDAREEILTVDRALDKLAFAIDELKEAGESEENIAGYIQMVVPDIAPILLEEFNMELTGTLTDLVPDKTHPLYELLSSVEEASARVRENAR